MVKKKKTIKASSRRGSKTRPLPSSDKTLPTLLGERDRSSVLDIIAREYPDARCSLDFTSPLELLVATILSAQCTDLRVNQVTKDLFKKYVRAKDYYTAPTSELEEIIRSTGFFKNKTKAIQGAGRMIDLDFAGQVPNTMDELLLLPGVARKTANVVLGNAYHVAEGIVVDTHVARLSQRIGLSCNQKPEKIEKDLMEIVPQDQWTVFSHRLISHGRAICTARSPKCAECPLEEVCLKLGVD